MSKGNPLEVMAVGSKGPWAHRPGKRNLSDPGKQFLPHLATSLIKEHPDSAGY